MIGPEAWKSFSLSLREGRGEGERFIVLNSYGSSRERPASALFSTMEIPVGLIGLAHGLSVSKHKNTNRLREPFLNFVPLKGVSSRWLGFRC